MSIKAAVFDRVARSCSCEAIAMLAVHFANGDRIDAEPWAFRLGVSCPPKAELEAAAKRLSKLPAALPNCHDSMNAM